MNDQAQHDQLWAETVSLLSAGCLSPEDERAARQHLGSCATCRERFRQLAALCEGLETSRPANLECAADFAGRVMAAVSTHPPRPNILKVQWRWGVALALAASLMLALTLRSVWPSRPSGPELAHRPQPVATPKPPGPPTLFAYERSFALSSEATNSLLDQEARRLSFLSAGDARLVAMKELLQ